jgi:hypothetical protein
MFNKIANVRHTTFYVVEIPCSAVAMPLSICEMLLLVNTKQKRLLTIFLCG